MGNADQTRVIRLIIPAADVNFISEHLLHKRGRANAAWWLSRGKARHLFKACDVLAALPDVVKAGEASRILKNELDHIGQHPTQVPSAVTTDLSATKVPFLLDIAPVHLDEIKCYQVDDTVEAELSDNVAEAFNLSKDTAILFGVRQHARRAVRHSRHVGLRVGVSRAAAIHPARAMLLVAVCVIVWTIGPAVVAARRLERLDI